MGFKAKSAETPNRGTVPDAQFCHAGKRVRARHGVLDGTAGLARSTEPEERPMAYAGDGGPPPFNPPLRPRLTAAGSLPCSSGVGARSGVSPVAMSTMLLASWFVSRGRFLVAIGTEDRFERICACALRIPFLETPTALARHAGANHLTLRDLSYGHLMDRATAEAGYQGHLGFSLIGHASEYAPHRDVVQLEVKSAESKLTHIARSPKLSRPHLISRAYTKTPPKSSFGKPIRTAIKKTLQMTY